MFKKLLCSAALCCFVLPAAADGLDYDYFQFSGIKVDLTDINEHAYIYDLTLGFAPDEKTYYELGLGSAVEGSEYLSLKGGWRKTNASGQSVYGALGGWVSGDAVVTFDLGGRFMIEDFVELNTNAQLYRHSDDGGVIIGAGIRAFVTEGFAVGLNVNVADDDTRETWLSFRFVEVERPYGESGLLTR